METALKYLLYQYENVNDSKYIVILMAKVAVFKIIRDVKKML